VDSWVLVDPVAKLRRVQPPASKRDPGRQLRKVGFFSNSKPNAAEIQAVMAARLSDRHGVEARFYRKPNASVEASPEQLEDIATECDAVFTGSGD
jgi:hypothetical protein